MSQSKPHAVIVHPIHAMASETVEINWTQRTGDGLTETLIERHTCPPASTWEARRERELRAGPDVTQCTHCGRHPGHLHIVSATLKVCPDCLRLVVPADQLAEYLERPC